MKLEGMFFLEKRKRLDAGDCMGNPVKAMDKINLGCDACRQVFCR